MADTVQTIKQLVAAKADTAAALAKEIWNYKVIKEVDAEGTESNRQNALKYVEEGKEYKKSGF